MYKSIATAFAILLMSLFASFAFAQEEAATAAVEESLETQEIPATPHATVELVSEELVGMLDDAKSKFKNDPQQFYDEIDSVISPWLDFNSWARGVMGSYAAEASDEQIATFASVFRTSLIETYAKGLINVETARFEVAPPRDGDEAKTTVGVMQTLYSGSDKIQVLYAMQKSEEGRWQFRNVQLDGVNLGRTFRNQFANAVASNDGDIDKAIADWGV